MHGQGFPPTHFLDGADTPSALSAPPVTSFHSIDMFQLLLAMFSLPVAENPRLWSR